MQDTRGILLLAAAQLQNLAMRATLSLKQATVKDKQLQLLAHTASTLTYVWE